MSIHALIGYVKIPFLANAHVNLKPLGHIRMKKPYFLDLKRFLWTEGVSSAPEISKNIFPPGMYASFKYAHFFLVT